MKKYPWIVLSAGVLVSFALAPIACGGGSGGSTTGTGGTGGSAPATSSMQSSGPSGPTGSSSGTGGGAPDCTGVFNPGDCGTCMESKCCQEVANCSNDASCIDCLVGNETDPAICDAEPTKSAISGFNACQEASCKPECFAPTTPALEPSCDAPTTAASNGTCVTVGGMIACNPVTNAPCKPDEACDFSGAGFKCYPPPNAAKLCGACSNGAEPYCGGTTHCLDDSDGKNGKCGRFCCTDADCGTGKCDTMATGVTGLGFCIAAATGTGGSTPGTGGSTPGTGGSMPGTGGANP